MARQVRITLADDAALEAAEALSDRSEMFRENAEDGQAEDAERSAKFCLAIRDVLREAVEALDEEPEETTREMRVPAAIVREDPMERIADTFEVLSAGIIGFLDEERWRWRRRRP